MKKNISGIFIGGNLKLKKNLTRKYNELYYKQVIWLYYQNN